MASVGTGQNSPGKCVTFEAASDLSSYQYRAVILNSSGQVTPGTGGTLINTSPAVGILQNKPSGTSHAAEVMVDGISKLYAEAAVTVGTYVTFGTVGGGSALIALGTCQIVGLCVKSADTAGDYAEVLINPFRHVNVTS